MRLGGATKTGSDVDVVANDRVVHSRLTSYCPEYHLPRVDSDADADGGIGELSVQLLNALLNLVGATRSACHHALGMITLIIEGGHEFVTYELVYVAAPPLTISVCARK